MAYKKPLTIYDNYISNLRSSDALQTDISGNAETASKLKTPITITFTGDFLANTTFDGSDDITISGNVPKLSEKVDTEDLSNLAFTGSFSDISDKPSTIFGYGITDSYTKSEVDTDLNGKAGVDLANVNQTGKTLIANMAMPSGQYVDLSFPQNGTTEYTAPSGGYFCLSCDASNGFIQLLNPANGLITGYSVPEGAACRLYIPAKKGEKIQATVSATVISQYAFRFIYAEGSKPE